MQSVIKRPCPATRIHFQPYGQPNVERKTTTGERHPAASSRSYPSTCSHPRRGRRPRRPGNLPSPPIPGKTPGPGMPGPYRAAAGKPPAVRKRPRRGQDPSLRTTPSTSARPYSAYVNYIRRAGCPHPAASSRNHPSTGSHPRRGRRPRRPGNLPSPPIPGETSGPGMPGPYRAYVNYIRRAGCPHPAASSRGSPSAGSHPRRGRRPRRPGNLPSPPIPGKTPGPGMPGPYRAAAGKPPAVRKRPRRGQDPSLRTDPSTSACPYSAYVNYIRRAGCPHPAASSRGYPSTGSHPRRGRRPLRPGNLPSPPIPGKTPGPGMPGPHRAAVGKPYAVRKRPRRGQDPSLRTAHQRVHRPPTARRCGDGDKKTEAIPFPGTASVPYISA